MISLPYTKEIRKKVLGLISAGLSYREIQKVVDISLDGISRIKNSVSGEEFPNSLEDVDGLPESQDEPYLPYVIDSHGDWLMLYDCHLPSHDKQAIELAIKEAKRRNVAGVIIGGDFLDCHELSSHDKDPQAARYVKEIEIGQSALQWIRKELPNAQIVYKVGNHEERLNRYVYKNSPALFGLKQIQMPSLLGLADLGIDWVDDKRVIHLGKLSVIHGHEYAGGVSSPINPARGLYMKASGVAIAGHHHKTSEYHKKNIRCTEESSWTVGCLCYIHPRYMRINDWNLGYAVVRLASDGTFVVENKRVMGGKIV